jgi:transposase InsO family protein
VARSLPGKTPADVEEAVCALRELRFSGTRIAEALGMPERTVRAVLARNGLSKLPRIDADEPPNRYERPAPGELIHIDVKKLGRIGREGHRVHGDRRTRTRGIGWEFVHVAIDDCTRLAYVEVLDDERTDSVVGFFARAVAFFNEHGITVQRLMTDNGPAYRSHAHAAVCRQLAIRHLFTQPYRPKTNGKAERFIRTLLAEWAYGAAYPTSAARTRALTAFLTRYNHHRPHKALGGSPPAKRLTERLNAPAAYS